MSRVVLETMSMTDDDIRKQWEHNRTLAAKQGTWMHRRFKAHLNRVPVDEGGAEFAMFRTFLSTLGGITAYRTEWTIFGDEEWLAGSIDFVGLNATGSLVLYDWK